MNDVDKEGVCDGTREQKSTRSIFECSLFRVVVATSYLIFLRTWRELLEVLRGEVTCQLKNTMNALCRMPRYGYGYHELYL